MQTKHPAYLQRLLFLTALIGKQGCTREYMYLYSFYRYEREVWDLYGVWFTDHPDLYAFTDRFSPLLLTPDTSRRRILTDYGIQSTQMKTELC